MNSKESFSEAFERVCQDILSGRSLLEEGGDQFWCPQLISYGYRYDRYNPFVINGFVRLGYLQAIQLRTRPTLSAKCREIDPAVDAAKHGKATLLIYKIINKAKIEELASSHPLKLAAWELFIQRHR